MKIVCFLDSGIAGDSNWECSTKTKRQQGYGCKKGNDGPGEFFGGRSGANWGLGGGLSVLGYMVVGCQALRAECYRKYFTNSMRVDRV